MLGACPLAYPACRQKLVQKIRVAENPGFRNETTAAEISGHQRKVKDTGRLCTERATADLRRKKEPAYFFSKKRISAISVSTACGLVPS